MRITESNITMSSKTVSQKQYTKEENLRTWGGNNATNTSTQVNAANNLLNPAADTLQISDLGKSLQSLNNEGLDKLENGDYLSLELSDKDEQKIRMIEKMIEMLTGKKLNFIIPKAIKVNGEAIDLNKLKNYRLESAVRARQGLGMEFNSHESYRESQKMSFNSEGTIKTADGKEINFSYALNMSREFYTEQNINIRAGDAARIDPLVINFDRPAAGLTDSKISFDIDSDGKSDQISFVAKGSGFLSLDLNEDGIINNGTELFGPHSGNGFSDLAKYDSDGNNWIDENDPIYDKLRIWTKDDNGNDVLFALGQKGIGAIYLGNIATSFDIKNNANESQGLIQKTGIFVKEDSTVGTIQHIDLSL